MTDYCPVRTTKKSLCKEISLHDTIRNEDVLVNVHYPKPDNGKVEHHFEHVKFPVVLISPLALGGKDCYKNLAQNIATAGYVCIVISHQDNVKLQRRKNGVGWLIKEGGPKKIINSVYNTPKFTFERICDILFIIKSFRIIELSIVHLRNHILFDKISIIGHSFGAMTAMLAAGVKVEIAKDVVSNLPMEYAPIKHEEPNGVTLYSWEIPNLKSSIIISPMGTGFFGLCDNSFCYKVPVMFFTGSNDHSIGNEHDNDWKQQAYEKSQVDGIPKYVINFFNADHGFGDIAGSAIVSTFAGWNKDDTIQSYIFRCSCALLDASCTDNRTAQTWLDNQKGGSNDKTAKIFFYSGDVLPSQSIPVDINVQQSHNQYQPSSQGVLFPSEPTQPLYTSQHLQSSNSQPTQPLYSQNLQPSNSQPTLPLYNSYISEQPSNSGTSGPRQRNSVPSYTNPPPTDSYSSYQSYSSSVGNNIPNQGNNIQPQAYSSSLNNNNYMYQSRNSATNNLPQNSQPQAYNEQNQYHSQQNQNQQPQYGSQSYIPNQPSVQAAYQPKTVDHHLEMEACFIPPNAGQPAQQPTNQQSNQFSYLSGISQDANNNNSNVPAYLKY